MKAEQIFARAFTELSEKNRDSCPDLETICAYTDNSLTFNGRKTVEEHLLNCSCCFNLYIEVTEDLESLKHVTIKPPLLKKSEITEKGYFKHLISLFSRIFTTEKSYSPSWFGGFALGSVITVMLFMFFINRPGFNMFLPKGTAPSGPSSVNYVLTEVSDELIAMKHYKDGEIFLKNSELDRAKEEFLQSLKFNPDQAEAHWYLASIYEKEGNYKKAINHFKRYISVSPRAGSYKEAKEFLEKLERLHPEQ